jgi:hypothetical protein
VQGGNAGADSLNPVSDGSCLPTCLPTGSPAWECERRLRTVPTLDSHRASIPAVDGMEEVRGSSPLSSTAKVLVKAYLILKDAWLSYATEGHLELTDAIRPRSATL